MSVLVIAEAGVNHNGDLEIAKTLIDVAADAKADIVKFQTFSLHTVVSRHVADHDSCAVGLTRYRT